MRMKKNYLVALTALFAATSTMAQAPHTVSFLPINGQKTATEAVQKRTMKVPAHLLRDFRVSQGMPAKAAKKDATAPTLITGQPEGTAYDLYRSTTGYYSFWGNAMETSARGAWNQLVMADDGTVYLRTPIQALPVETWIKGTKAKGDTLEFKLPQAIYSEEGYTGELDYGYLYKMKYAEDDNKKTYEVDPDSQTLQYVWRGDSLQMVNAEMTGLCLESGGWIGYGEKTSTAWWTPDNTTQPKDAASAEDVMMLYMDTQEQALTTTAKVAIEGSDVYMGNFGSTLPNHWIKGEMKDGTAVFPAQQLVGIDKPNFSYMYASAVGAKRIAADYYEEDSVYLTGKPLEFAYDAANHTLSCRDMLGLHYSKDDLSADNVVALYNHPMTYPWVKEAAAPLPPVFTAYQPYDDMYGYGGVQFKLSYYSVNGNYLDPAHLFYSFYIDGEVYTFSTDEYRFFPESTTTVAYDYADSYDIYSLSQNERRMYFYKGPEEKLGIEALYMDGDTRLSSGITEYSLTPTGISSNVANEKRIECVDYVDLSGRKVAAPTKGIYVRTVTYADGSKLSKAVVK